MDKLNPRRNALLLGLSLALLAGCDRLPGLSSKATFKAVDITGAEYARELALTDADGKLRQLSDFKGKVTLVFFGYTQCPDVCPTWPRSSASWASKAIACRACSSASIRSATHPKC
jgi:cytochrome oxidase Cu insertion factor (SCO1/SenC/PrrC family)